jgi:hypothetical protein
MSKRLVKRRSSLAERIFKAIDRGRAQYERADALTNQLIACTPPGTLIETSRGAYELTDNYAHSNTAFRPARVNRYELKKLKKSEAAPVATPS